MNLFVSGISFASRHFNAYLSLSCVAYDLEDDLKTSMTMTRCAAGELTLSQGIDCGGSHGWSCSFMGGRNHKGRNTTRRVVRRSCIVS